MRYFAQGLILIVGFTLAIVAANLKSSAPRVGNCYDDSGSDVPMLCE